MFGKIIQKTGKIPIFLYNGHEELSTQKGAES